MEGFSQTIPRQSHSVGQVVLFLQFVVAGVLGFRGAAFVLAHCETFWPTDEPAISANGGQMWLLRVGLYELRRPKEVADDWVWIIDHTIQVGRGKCFVVVGVRGAAWQALRIAPQATGALSPTDLSVWKIELVEKSDGPTVERQLTELAHETGQVPRAILSDCGGDLNAGVAAFAAAHPRTLVVKDLPHFAANALKKELSDDPDWTRFLADANRSKTRLRQTKFAFLLPPDLKSKARWMNLDPLIAWSENVLRFLDSPRDVPGVTLTTAELNETLAWLAGHRDHVHRWSEMLAVVESSLRYIRQQGYHAAASQELRDTLSSWLSQPHTPAGRMANRLVDYVAEQSAAIPPGEHVLATSEVLESLLGKGKQLQGEQSRGGFTKMVLGIAASVVKLTNDTVTQALTAIRVRDVTTWLTQFLPVSIQAQRYHALHADNSGTNPY